MLHLITGGSGSGKSAFAESCIVQLGGGNRFYIATMFPFDDESHARIRRHREMRREKEFTTVECFTNLKQLTFPEGSHILLEDMSNLVANELYREDGAHEDTVSSVVEGIRQISDRVDHMIIVTNEVFSDRIEYDQESEHYLACMGRINQQIAAWADRVTEVVYGIPITVKGGQHEVSK